MTFTGINPQFAIPSNQKEQQYPALQVNSYKPQTINDKIQFCLSEDSFNLLPENNPLQTEIIECIYSQERVLMHQITSDLRWIFLTIPRLFKLHKKTREVSSIEKGFKFKDTPYVTVAKCFLACLVNNELVLDFDGLPQIFTLKLTSSKTQLIGNSNQSESKTITSLNRELQKIYKTKDNLVHLVSVNLKCVPKEFISSHTGDSSLGVNFELDGNAKSLSSPHQQLVFDLVRDESIQALFNDPFDLNLFDKVDLTPDFDDIGF